MSELFVPSKCEGYKFSIYQLSHFFLSQIAYKNNFDVQLQRSFEQFSASTAKLRFKKILHEIYLNNLHY